MNPFSVLFFIICAVVVCSGIVVARKAQQMLKSLNGKS
jgi:hypothetical protein